MGSLLRLKPRRWKEELWKRFRYWKLTSVASAKTRVVIMRAWGSATAAILGVVLAGASKQISANSGQSFIEYLFYFFFPPPGDCVEGASAAYERAVKGASGEDQRTPDLGIYSECKPSRLLRDFFSWQLSPGVLFQSMDGVKGARGRYPKFYVPPMEKLEANGLTFFIFEALGQTQLDLRAVNHFNLPDDLRGGRRTTSGP